MILTTPDDVAAIFRPLTDEEVNLTEALIRQASVKLQVRLPNLEQLVTQNQLAYDLARDAVANAVKRVLQNPEGLRQVSTTTGPYSDSKTYDSAVSASSLYIDPADLVGLIPAGKRVFGNFSVQAGLL